jgi:hypothetical protein
MREGRILVKCKKCGAEYEMPDFGVDVTMNVCHVCRDITKTLETIISQTANQTN